MESFLAIAIVKRIPHVRPGIIPHKGRKPLGFFKEGDLSGQGTVFTLSCQPHMVRVCVRNLEKKNNIKVS